MLKHMRKTYRRGMKIRTVNVGGKYMNSHGTVYECIELDTNREVKIVCLLPDAEEEDNNGMAYVRFFKRSHFRILRLSQLYHFIKNVIDQILLK